MNPNDFVNFEKMFSYFISDNMEYMKRCISEAPMENETYKKILQFYNNDKYHLEIDISECEMRDDVIIFVFGEEHQTANESNNQNEWTSVAIHYDRKKDAFTIFEQEQG